MEGKVVPTDLDGKTLYLEAKNLNEFEALSRTFAELVPKIIHIPSLGFNLFVCSDNRSIIYSSDFGIVICNKQTLEVVKSVKLVTGRVKSFICSEHNSLLFLGEMKGILHVFDMVTLQPKMQVQMHSSAINKLILSFDELLLFSCSNNSEVSMLNLSTFEVKVLYTHDSSAVRNIDLSPDGEILVSVGDDWVKTYSIMREKLLNSVEVKDNVFGIVKFGFDGNFFCTGDVKGKILLWDTASLETTEVGEHAGEVNRLWCTEELVISTGTDKIMRFWNLKGTSRPMAFPLPDNAIEMIVKDDYIYMLLNGSLQFLKVPSMPQEKFLKSPSRAATKMLFVSKKKLLVTSSGEKKALIWSTESFSLLKEVNFEGTVFAICLSSDQKYFYASLNTKVIVRVSLDGDFPYELFTTSEYIISSMVCTLDNSYLVTIDNSCKCVIRKLIDAEVVCYYNNHRNSGQNVLVTFLSNILVTVGCDSMIFLYSLQTRKNIGKMGGFKGEASQVRLSMDDRLIALSNRLGQIYIYSIEKESCIKILKVPNDIITDLSFTQDNQHLLVSTITPDGAEIYFFALEGFCLVCSFVSPKHIQCFKLIDDEKCIAIGEDKGIWFRPNPLKSESLCIVGPSPFYPVGFMNYLIDIAKGRVVEHSPEMDKFTVFPNCINSLQYYANFNLTSYLSKGLSQNASILQTTSGANIMNISLSKGYSDNVKLILSHLVESLKNDPYSACFMHSSLLDLNSQSCPELEQFYNAIFFKSQDLSLPRFSDTSEGFWKSPFFEIHHKEVLQVETSGNCIAFYQSAVKINTEIGSQMSIQYMDSILNTGNNEIFRSQFIATILEKKWEEVQWFIVTLALFYFSYLAILSLYTLDQQNSYFVIVLFLQNAVLILYELFQVTLTYQKYFTDMWNFLDLFRILLFVLYFALDTHYNSLLFFLHLFSWAKGVSYFRIFSSTRYMVNLLQEVVKDILAFIIIFFYFTLAFTFMLVSVQDSQNYSDFYRLGDTFLLNFGSFTISEEDHWLMWLCFVISSMINFLVMVNLLISIIGDTYDKVQTFKVIADRRELAEIILEIEELMIWKRKVNADRYLHMVCSDSKVDNEGSWEGRVRELQNTIFSIGNSVKSHQVCVDEKFQLLSLDISKMSAKLDKVLAK